MENVNEVTDQIAGTNAIYAMMACNCYHETGKLQFPIEILNWQLVDRDGEPTDKPSKDGFITGFAYDIFENQTSNNSVIAFRGTDSKKDWFLSNIAVPFSIPYKSAIKAVRKYLEKNPSRNLTVVGHSLGGGLALGASVHQGVPAITFDPSPRIFDGLGDYHFPARRLIIFQHGEVLEKLRSKLIDKAYDVVDLGNVYEAKYDFGPDNAHRIDILAANLTKQGLTANVSLTPIVEWLGDRP